MLCRLCLNELKEDDAILLFEPDENVVETALTKMIAKYLQLMLNPDDAISTSICQNCYDHLEEFHRYWSLVDQKQSTLRNEFLEVECDVKFALQMDDDIAALADNDETLLELKYVPLECVESELATPEDEFACAKPETNTSSQAAHDMLVSNLDSDDEDVPLTVLLPTNKNKNTSKKSKSQHKSKVKAQNKKNVATRKSKRKCKSKNISDTEADTETDTDKESNSDADSTYAYKPIQKNKDLGSKLRQREQNSALINSFMKLACDLCNHIFPTFGELCEHFKTVHEQSAYVKCCKGKFTRIGKLAEHIRLHQNPDLYKCDICDKCLGSRHYLRQHRLKAHDTEEVSELIHCEICKKVFRSKKCFKNHMHNHEKKSQKALEFTCEICQKCFFTAQRLQSHIRSIHENISPHVCDICGKKFKMKYSFDRHYMQHQGVVEQPMQCTICFKWLKHCDSLRLHMLKHRSGNCECHICGRVYLSRSTLLKHIRYMHKNKKEYKCTYCDKVFKDPKNLEEHVAIHTGALLYSCPHCSKECRSSSNMYVHIKRYHEQEWLRKRLARSNDPSLNLHPDGAKSTYQIMRT